MARLSKQPPAAFNVAASLVVLAAAIGLAFLAWRYYEYTPWSRDGRVLVYTVQVAPEVSGTVVDLAVKGNQFVHKGDLLFQIDPGTFTNAVGSAEGRLAQARAQQEYLVADARRLAALPDIAASAQQKQNAGGVAQSSSAAALEAEAALAQARLNLRRTTVRSPVNGWVSDLILQRGSFANTGTSALTLVDADSFWVEGFFEETQAPRIALGDAARITLMAYPNHPLTGHVAGLARGISVSDVAPGVGGLPSVNPVFTWVRLAQRLPIRIELDDVPCPVTLYAGMTATVLILDHRAAIRATHICDQARSAPP